MKSSLTLWNSVAIAIAIALLTSLLPGFAAQGRTAYLLLINESSSMNLLFHDPGARRYRIARLFIERLHQGDLIQLLEFASEVQPLLPDWTTVSDQNRSRLQALLAPRQLDRRGSPRLMDALGQALATFDALPLRVDKRVVVLLSDGEPGRRSSGELYRLLQEFARQQIPIHTFALTSFEAPLLGEISTRTLAHAYRASGDFNLVALAVSRIIEESTVISPPASQEGTLSKIAGQLLKQLRWQVQLAERLSYDRAVKVSARLLLGAEALAPMAAAPDGWQVALDEAQVSFDGQLTEMRYNPTDRSYHADLGRRDPGSHRLRIEAHGRLIQGDYLFPFSLIAERQLTISAPPRPVPVPTPAPALPPPPTAQTASRVLHLPTIAQTPSRQLPLQAETAQTDLPPAAPGLPWRELLGGLLLVIALPYGLHQVREWRRGRELRPEQRFLTQGAKLTVGRDPESDLRIADRRRVARRHFSLAHQEERPDRLKVRDEGGGVYLKRRGQRLRRVSVQAEVLSGEEILIGHQEEGEHYCFRVIVQQDRYGLELLEKPDPSGVWSWIGWLVIALAGATTWLYLV
ncbi:MAG TPA: FHA domain-containing protein [Candidatus Fraserbacteria bacterium]|nr:FHA domain-containing protein [Candidatus Fraserbacteria bacterium]